MRIVLTVFSLVLASHAAAATRLELTNGDSLTGSIVEFSGTDLRFESSLLGEVAVPWPAVAAFSTDEEVVVTLRDGTVASGRLVFEGDTLTIVTPRGTFSVAKEEVTALRSREAQQEFEAVQAKLRAPGLTDLWTGALDAGLSATRGNSDTTTLNFGFRGERLTRVDKTVANASVLFARDSTEDPASTTANTIRGTLRYERNIRERLFSFGFTDLEFDELQNLDLRWVLGGGLDHRFWRTDRLELSLFGGGALNQEFFQGQDARRSAEVLFGEELQFRFSERTTFRERLTLFPNLSEAGEYRITFTSSLESRLNDWLSWRVALEDRFLSNPPPGTQKNNLLLTTGLRLHFGEDLPVRR